MRHFSGIKINSQTSSWSHFIRFRRAAFGMHVDWEFCIAKLRTHTTVWGGKKTIFFYCGESEQHPKWDSFAKAAPKTVWRLNILKEMMLEEGEREKRGTKKSTFLMCPNFWRNATGIGMDGISELVTWHLETIWGLPVIQNTPWQNCFFLRRDSLLWCTFTIFLWNCPECSTWPQDPLPNRRIENVCLLKCSDLRKIFQGKSSMHINVEHLSYPNHVLQTGRFLIDTTYRIFKFVSWQDKIKCKIQKFNCLLVRMLSQQD